MLRFLPAFFVLLLPLQAKADIFVYHDPDYGFQVSFPDDWRLQVATGTERVHFAPMHGEGQAECKIKVERDGRLTLYPENYMQYAVPLTLDDSFWKREILPNYKNHRVLSYHAAAGLGQGFGTSLQWVWQYVLNGDNAPPAVVNPVGLTPMNEAQPIPVKTASGPSLAMQAMSVASIYGENRYQMTCQSTMAMFDLWQPEFAEIFASVRLEDKYAPFPTGYYRDFLADK